MVSADPVVGGLPTHGWTTTLQVGSDGAVVMHIAVAADLAPTVVTENASGGFGVYLKPGN